MAQVMELPSGFRTPPHNIDAEQALLGAILINNDAYHRVASFLKPEHFYEPGHQRVFQAIARVTAAGGIADHITLRFEFESDETFRQAGVGNYLAALVESAHTVITVEKYGRLILEMAMKRRLMVIGERIAARAGDPEDHTSWQEQATSLLTDAGSLEGDGAEISPIVALDPIAMLEAPRPERAWAVAQWVPKRRLTLLAGDGGTGKSLVAQLLGTCIAVGVPWLGVSVEHGTVMMFATEDDADELTCRHQDICREIGAAPDALRGRLHLVPRVGMENRLVEFEGEAGQLTATWHSLVRSLDAVRPTFLILDNSAQLFAGNENSRAQVTWFCNRLEYLCQRFDMTILLLGHTSKSEESEWSGSTAWNACVRSRIFLKYSDDDDKDVRKLTRSKSNYASKGDEIDVRWQDGVLRAFISGEDVDSHQLGRARQAFKDALKTLTARGINVSHLKTAPRNYAPKVMIESGLAGEHKARILERAMISLIDDGTILPNQQLGWSGSGNKRTGLKFAYLE